AVALIAIADVRRVRGEQRRLGAAIEPDAGKQPAARIAIALEARLVAVDGRELAAEVDGAAQPGDPVAGRGLARGRLLRRRRLSALRRLTRSRARHEQERG